MDGVLVDPGPAHDRVWTRWAEARGLDPAHVRRVTQGRRRADTLRLVAGHLDPADEHRLLDRLMAAEEHRVRPCDGAAEVLTGLPAGSWALVTSSRATATVARLRRLGLPVPDVRVRGGRAAREAVARRSSPGRRPAGGPPARCTVIEDSPAGVAAGLAAGCAVLAVTTTHGPRDLARADARFPTLRAAVRHALTTGG
nr:HAD family hydrolase [Streptomyces sp. RFCAC02]